MSDADVLGIALNAMIVVGKILAPLLLVALVIGLIIGLLQAVTQVQEVTLTFVPKFIAMAVIFVFAGHWFLRLLIEFTIGLFNQIPNLIS